MGDRGWKLWQYASNQTEPRRLGSQARAVAASLIAIAIFSPAMRTPFTVLEQPRPVVTLRNARERARYVRIPLNVAAGDPRVARSQRPCRR